MTDSSDRTVIEFAHKNFQLDKNLKVLLRLNNMNTNQLSEATNIPLMTLRRLISGTTIDPRVSTLKLISNYFKVSIDSLVAGDLSYLTDKTVEHHAISLPILNWSALGDEINTSLCLKNFKKLEKRLLIPNPNNNKIGKNAFVLESRPSMYPKYPIGTKFVIDPALTPVDGDLIVIRLSKNRGISIRQLTIDPPNWVLTPLVNGSQSINFSTRSHQIIGIVFLTLFYNPRLN